MRCLWISRHVPYPMNEGLKVYSAKLSEALAQAGAFVRVLGFGSTEATPKNHARMEWVSVPGTRRATAIALLNRFPLTAAVDSTETATEVAQSEEPADASESAPQAGETEK